MEKERQILLSCILSCVRSDMDGTVREVRDMNSICGCGSEDRGERHREGKKEGWYERKEGE